MSNYIDLVVVDTEFGKRLFKAPAWSYLKNGDKVTVDTRAGIKVGTVLNSLTVKEEDEEYNFVFSACNATKPLKKVVAKIVDVELRYPEDTVKEDDDEQTDAE